LKSDKLNKKKKMGQSLNLQKILMNKNVEKTESDFEIVWKQFSRNDNYGIISLNRCKRFLQDLCLSLYKPYDPNNERIVRLKYDRESKGYLTKEHFFHYFVNKLKEENYKFTSSLMEKFKQVDMELGSDFEDPIEKNIPFDDNFYSKSVSFIYPKNMLTNLVNNNPPTTRNREIVNPRYLAEDNRHFHSLSNSCWVKSTTQSSSRKFYSWGNNNFGLIIKNKCD
jgi:hypothetical protein